ncbi:MAG: pyruvate dehydrogenase (acetyl-transferring) E1 component subunit alpha [Acidobacteriota bacterium]|nr:MAG: pyruvate dehydrogenase (acetyl-transferring) E1 component subunit alpha [Acidobacteriota bacterium]
MREQVQRIIDENGKVIDGAQLPDLSEDDLIRLYRLMLFNRRVDERMTKLQRQGRIGFYVGSTGEEASIIGSAFALEPEDWIVPCYREVGAAFARGYGLFDFLCQIYGNTQDVIKGRQMPCHWASRELRLASVSSPVGTQIPHALGMAMAASIKGTQEVALTFFGDGATSTGDFHVSCNFAGVFKAPVIFLCRNNHWAISVPVGAQTAQQDLAEKAKAYAIDGVRVDGNDVLAMYAATRQAAEKARRGEGPTLIEAQTYRQGAHTTSDDPRAYRDDAEVDQWLEKDPICRFRTFLIERGVWSEEQDSALEEEFQEEIRAAIEEVEKIGPPDLDTLFEDVLDEVPWHLEEQRDELKSLSDQ